MKYLFLLPLLLMVGCAGGDYQHYAQTMSEHSVAEKDRITAQSNSISDMVMVTKTETPMEATLLAVIGMMQVERLQPVALNMSKPTTGMDVADTFMGHIPFIAGIGGMVWQSSILASELTGMTITDSAVTNSFNPTSAVGAGNASAVGATPPVVVEPFVVEPMVIQ